MARRRGFPRRAAAVAALALLGLAAWLGLRGRSRPRDYPPFVEADAVLNPQSWSNLVNDRAMERDPAGPGELGSRRAYVKNGRLFIKQPVHIPPGQSSQVSGLAFPFKILGDLMILATVDLDASRAANPKGRSPDSTWFYVAISTRGDASDSGFWLSPFDDLRGPPAFGCYGRNRSELPASAREARVRIVRRDRAVTVSASFDGGKETVCPAPLDPRLPVRQIEAGVMIDRGKGDSGRRLYRSKGNDVYALRQLRASCIDPDGCVILGREDE